MILRMFDELTASGAIALACALLAALIVVVYLLKRPAFTLATQLWLLFGLGVLPLITAGFGNAAGLHATKEVRFCSSCHVMLAHTGDVLDLDSQSLAARHSRNTLFGDQSCYTCHADYGMFGAVFTKLNGMTHVYHYLLTYRKKTLEETLPELHLYKPFANANCMQCHSTTNRLWLNLNDHAAAVADVRSGKLSCASEGCHGYAHPFSKAARAARAAREVP
jgi:cytochrome c-type protein NapC